MGTGRLRTYLRSHRTLAGLSQIDLAFLLGDIDDTLISKYENNLRVPPLEVALALQEIFKAPVTELFAGIHEPIAAAVASRIRELSSNIHSENCKDPKTLRKIAWLGQRHGLPEAHNHTIPCTC